MPDFLVAPSIDPLRSGYPAVTMSKTSLIKPKLKYSTKNAKRKAKAVKNGGKTIKTGR